MTAFVARYPGWCNACDERINVGDQCKYREDRIVHVDCAESAPVERPVLICSRCHLTTARLTDGFCPDCAAET